MISKIFSSVAILFGFSLNFYWPKVISIFVMSKIGILNVNKVNLYWVYLTEPEFKLIYSGSLIIVGLISGIFFGLLVTNERKPAVHRQGLVFLLFLSFCIFTLGPFVIGQGNLNVVELFKVGVKSVNIHLFAMFGFVGGFLYIVKGNFSFATILGFAREKIT